MKSALFILLAALAGHAAAAEPLPESFPGLPPAEVVAHILREHPDVQAAAGQIRVEEAHRQRLEAGEHEWNVRLGGQQRRSRSSTGPEEQFNEWNAALERPLRLPGKAALDGRLGAAGVALAETAHGDARHEASRRLLADWFAWRKEAAAVKQWGDHLALLEKQAKAVHRRQQLGDAARLEAIQAEAALAQAQAQAALADVRLQAASETLRRRYPGLLLEAPAGIDQPLAIAGSETEWVDAILEHSHELLLARSQAQRAQVQAGRADQERRPDPTVGLQISRERAGEDRIIGAFISIPLPGGARRATSDAALAQADVANRQEAATLRKISLEAATLYQSAKAALATWQAGRQAAEHLNRVAEMTARAYQLGEGTLNDLLIARRQANEAQLASRLLQLEALESRYRLLLDTHRLWDLD
jgi:outer membrane protein, heavy metal efflux system